MGSVFSFPESTDRTAGGRSIPQGGMARCGGMTGHADRVFPFESGVTKLPLIQGGFRCIGVIVRVRLDVDPRIGRVRAEQISEMRSGGNGPGLSDDVKSCVCLQSFPSIAMSCDPGNPRRGRDCRGRTGAFISFKLDSAQCNSGRSARSMNATMSPLIHAGSRFGAWDTVRGPGGRGDPETRGGGGPRPSSLVHDWTGRRYGPPPLDQERMRP